MQKSIPSTMELSQLSNSAKILISKLAQEDKPETLTYIEFAELLQILETFRLLCSEERKHG